MQIALEGIAVVCIAGALTRRSFGSFFEDIALPLYFNQYTRRSTVRRLNLAKIVPLIYAKSPHDLAELISEECHMLLHLRIPRLFQSGEEAGVPYLAVEGAPAIPSTVIP